MQSDGPVLVGEPLQDGEGDDLPSIWVALQEQLGLRLEPTKALVEVLVVDHIEKPGPN